MCRALHKRKLGLKCPFFLAKAPKVAAKAKAKLTKSRSKTKVVEEVEEEPAPVEEEPVVSLSPERQRHPAGLTASLTSRGQRLNTALTVSQIEAKPTRATKSRKAKASVASVPMSSDHESEAAAPLKK